MDDGVTDDMLAAAQGRHAVYDFLARLFLNPIPTPGHGYAETFLRAIEDHAFVSDLEDFRDGTRALNGFKAMAGGGDLEEVQRQLAVDRTRLCRGTAKDRAVAPPYEASYLTPENETDRLLVIVQLYRKAGLQVSGGPERMDFIGVELAFMAELCAKEHAALSAAKRHDYEAVLAWEKEFLQEHLLKWAVDYSGQMIDHAQTDFFRGFGYLMRAFLQEESELCDP